VPQPQEPVRAYVEVMLGRVEEQVAAGVAVASVEEALVVDVREIGRLGLQKFLDGVAAVEARREVTGGDGVPRPRVEQGHTRPLRSVFGEVTVTRWAYRARPVPDEPQAQTGPDAVGRGRRTPGNLYPADAVLNLPAGKDSWGLARLVAAEAARGAFEETVAAVERASGQRVGKRQAEQIAATAAADVDAFYAARRPGPCPGKTLMLQADGKGVVMRPQALRPGAAARAATRAPSMPSPPSATASAPSAPPPPSAPTPKRPSPT